MEEGASKERDRTGKDATIPVVNATSEFFEYPRDVRKSFSDNVHQEVPGDVFDRQRCIPQWNQGTVEKQACFVLGTGGLGQTVAAGLARLGVAEIVCLDKDTYDPSNLTRQILGGLKDCGRRKVDVANTGIQVHNLRSKLRFVHCDAIGEWKTVVKIAASSTVIFNCCDAGIAFDIAVWSLCCSLKIPYITGSSFAWNVEVSCYDTSTQASRDLFLENHDADISNMLTNAIQKAKEDGLDYAEALHMSGSVAEQIKKDISLSREVRERASDETVPSGLMKSVMRHLTPERIAEHEDICFIPRNEHFPTRRIGSWVGVCCTAGMLMVNAFVQRVIVDNDDFPSDSYYNLNTAEGTNPHFEVRLEEEANEHAHDYHEKETADLLTRIASEYKLDATELKRKFLGGSRIE